MIINLNRVSRTSTGTYGVLTDQYDVPFAVTAERPWLDNKPDVSCIPEGTYKCKRVQSPHFGDTFEVTDVVGRTHILFHKGNVPQKDSNGCILVAEKFGWLGGRTAVLSSKAGFATLKQLTHGVDMFVLNIT